LCIVNEPICENHPHEALLLTGNRDRCQHGLIPKFGQKECATPSVGFGEYIHWPEGYLAKAEHIVLAAIMMTAVTSFAWRALKPKRLRRREK
jgi:hypothetical protein